jgi:hypothetical protein
MGALWQWEHYSIGPVYGYGSQLWCRACCSRNSQKERNGNRCHYGGMGQGLSTVGKTQESGKAPGEFSLQIWARFGACLVDRVNYTLLGDRRLP